MHNFCCSNFSPLQCRCQEGFTGHNCEARVDLCQTRPCRNGGTCESRDGYFLCHCPRGFTGQRCESLVDWCSSKPCEHGARCSQSGSTFHCACPSQWTGKVCDVKKVSCDIAANQRGTTVSQLCQNGGRCVNEGLRSHRCECRNGFSGSYCQDAPDACASNPCLNGASCLNHGTSFSCACPKGFQGVQCEYNVNDCAGQPCRNGGTCNDLIGDFSCSCPPGTEGKLCEVNVDDCKKDSCFNGGQCVDRVGTFECLCPPGFTGQRCEGDINECLSQPCARPGTADCVQLLNDYQCNCRPGWRGRLCEIRVDFCASNPCANGGACTVTESGHFCTCTQGFSGPDCSIYSGRECATAPCRNGGTCVADPYSKTGYRCQCPTGTNGSKCEIDTVNECGVYNPCGSSGRCTDKAGGYECFCKAKYRGRNCQIFDLNAPGGVDITARTNHPDRFAIEDFQKELRMCKLQRCDVKSGDGLCHSECNKLACKFDGGDCNLGINPWNRCNATSRGRPCSEVFQDGICDQSCNYGHCLFDGNDCGGSDTAPGRCEYSKYCTANYDDGQCDEGCNNAACGFDGGDCVEESKHERPTDGSIYFVLAMKLSQFHDQFAKLFERFLSLKLQTTLKIKRDENGQRMVYTFDQSDLEVEEEDSSFNTGITGGIWSFKEEEAIIVYMEVDNANCARNCYDKTSDLANYVAAAYSTELRDDWQVIQIGDSSNDGPRESTQPIGMIIGILVLGLVIVCIGVVLQTNKKRKAKGITWFPDNFQVNRPLRPPGHRKGPDGQEMFGMPGSKMPSQFDLDHGYLQDGWSDDDPAERPSKRQNRRDTGHGGQTDISGFDDHDPRPWTAQHFNAADVKNSDILGALTPPQAEVTANERLVGDVDQRGPLGLTPLMVASIRGGGIDQGDVCENDEEDTSNAAIQDLIAQGSNIGAQMDKTGETPLHLASRYARADAAKKLLDAKADANAQDNTGRTPLHAAVAADAQGVFQILLRHRATDLNSKTSDGTTPLILAARLAIEGMVEDLIQADADINASDENGKSALHWAASVNNVDAVNTLLAHGANRDAQDCKDETPLFLSCREGSYQAAKALLDHCANRDITDHMDRLPRDVAQERLHHDIVRLLEEHIPPAPQPQVSQPLPTPSQREEPQLTPTKPKPKKRSKTSEGSPLDGSMMHSPPMPGLSMPGLNTLPKNRRPSVKRKKPEGHGMEGMMLSPEHEMYGHHLAMSHPNLEEMMASHGHGGNNLPLPTYEESMLQAQKMQQAQSMASGLQQQQQFEFMQQHPRQQSIPASMTYSHQLSPPQHGLMSPPQSVHSQHSLSPPGAPSANTHSTSPQKPRGLLPTSPTHMAAMRNHQRHQSFDFPESSQQLVVGHPGMQGMQGMFTYTNLPTPPGNNEGNAYMTPSPESPAWSSATSPQSGGEAVWSDGNLHSPPNFNQMNGLKREEEERRMNNTGIFI